MNRRQHIDISWYENDSPQLINQVDWCYKHQFGPIAVAADAKIDIENPIGIVSPHAGFSCSGPYAAHSFNALKKKKLSVYTAIILGPNHTGYGSAIAVYPVPGIWETPLGDIELDQKLSDELMDATKTEFDLDMDYDRNAHLEEHSIDNQLPFLQLAYEKCKIVPICLMDQRYTTCISIGKLLAKIIKDNQNTKNIAIIASSDFTHYEPHAIVSKKDQQVIANLEKMDLAKANELKNSLNVTACGFGPILALFSAAKELGKNRAKVLAYGTSGLTCSTKDLVVGYGSLIV